MSRRRLLRTRGALLRNATTRGFREACSCSSESYHIRGVRCTRVLHHVDLRIRHRVHRGVEPVRRPAKREDTLLARIPEARQTRRQQAHQHPPGAIGRRPPPGQVEAAVRHVLGIAGEVCARTPEGLVLRARGERLEARHRVADDRVKLTGAVEGPAGVDTGLEPHALVLQRSAQGVVIGFGAALQLQAVLYALDVHDPHLRPRLLWRELVRLSLKGQGLEQAAHPLELLAARGHLEQPPVSEALPTRRRPEPPQLLWREAEGALRL
mmetsp:Transcript_91046/g.257328  ORF Transcript_91046/g.257328 Transcript_91046/m.257328 type:complete len:267 (-) Transcript_91046:668-1468(-)